MKCRISKITKAFKTKSFALLSFFGIIIMLLHAVDQGIFYNDLLNQVQETNNTVNSGITLYSAYTLWIGGTKHNLYSTVYFYCLPLLASGSIFSYLLDIKNRISPKDKHRWRCHLSDYAVIFSLSGTAVALPLLISFLVILLIAPAISPDSVYDIYYGVFPYSFLGNLFYSAPILYVFAFIIVDFIFSGLIGCLSMTIAKISKNVSLSTLTPGLLLITIQLLKPFYASKFTFEISPITYLQPAKSTDTCLGVILLEMAFLTILILIGIIPELQKEVKK